MGTNRRSEIEMSPGEIDEFIASRRTATLATLGSGGQPHLVAMWFGYLDGHLWFETKEKSQKAVNLRRDPRVSVLFEDGDTYDTLRGVALEGHAEITTDHDALQRLGVDIWERYYGDYNAEAEPMVAAMLHKRIAVRVDVARTRSWDHRKLGLPPMPAGGRTAGG